jgi:hypothetical protein
MVQAEKPGENVLFKDTPTFLIIRPRHQDGLVAQALRALEELAERRVRLDEVVGGKRHAQALREIPDALRLGLAAAVGEQNERDVVVMEKVQHFGRPWDRLGFVHKNAIDAARGLVCVSVSVVPGTVRRAYSKAKAKEGGSGPTPSSSSRVRCWEENLN